jgi:phenylalanine-4-hydroxylase
MSNITASIMPTQTVVNVPAHLRQYVVEQNYPRYTPIDQAVWRYVLRQNSAFLQEKGFGSYYGGLQATGMSIETIPSIEEMSARLAELGWGAVAVDGFIPPVAFFDFQANGILPIACEMRTLEHIAYTPAPDIIHESAGHAPMLGNPGYGDFVKCFGEIGRKALATKEDHAVYEAIRLLSILKEDPTATAEEITAAEQGLDVALAAVTESSEATLLARLYWWTVEYGLIGDLDNPKLYGAGLLSSMGESRSCLDPAVTKIPFSLEACLSTDYDITKPQPQLFVCQDFDQLTAAVEQFSAGMAFRVGGTKSLVKAIKSGSTATMVYSSGLQVSGTLTDIECDASGEAVYLKTTGPTALAVNGQQLPEHGTDHHAEGFGAPIGKLARYETPLEDFSDLLLQRAGILVGMTARLNFRSGVRVVGVVEEIHRHPDTGKIMLITFQHCTVTRGDQLLFTSRWGPFDMAVGQKIDSVFAGSADPENFEDTSLHASAVIAKRAPVSERQQALLDLYQTVRNLRNGDETLAQAVDVIGLVLAELEQDFPRDWLLRVELLEMLTERGIERGLQERLRGQLAEIAVAEPDKKNLIDNGLHLLV